ncbi:hypothetical protein PHMEG_00011000 [Phytophthora megakarya]|uniref:Uncharacterized protein n=1 Tax=Phytophthora megakarya TaxID=4795 RepID=A0A225WCT2_9STRA|nr:hypothetical protein PHMEG_00011000 [Phytophthora megakarya]
MPPKKQRDKETIGNQAIDNVTADLSSPSTTNYQSPFKKLKSTIDKHQRKTIDNVDGKYLSPLRVHLREYIINNDGKDKEVCASVRIKARLLRIAPGTVANLQFLRHYFGEYQAPEPLQE